MLELKSFQDEKSSHYSLRKLILIVSTSLSTTRREDEVGRNQIILFVLHCEIGWLTCCLALKFNSEKEEGKMVI